MSVAREKEGGREGVKNSGGKGEIGRARERERERERKGEGEREGEGVN